jgi:hypothetical protein
MDTEYSCLVYGEGSKDKKFLKTLLDLDKFKYHTKRWIFNFDNASGESPKRIYQKCKKRIVGYDHDLVLCFIDLDKLKNDFPKKWQEEKKKLDNDSDIKIIWQLDCAEDEYKIVLGNINCTKHKLNKKAKKEIKKFINSDYWNRILKPIKNEEKKLDNNII